MASEHRVSCFEETALVGSLAGSLSVEACRVLSRQAEFLLIKWHLPERVECVQPRLLQEQHRRFGRAAVGQSARKPEALGHSRGGRPPNNEWVNALDSICRIGLRGGPQPASDQGWRYGIVPGATGQNRNFLYYLRPCGGIEFPRARFDPEAPPAAGLFDFANRDDVIGHWLVRLGGRVVMQRPAKPSTPVRFRP